MSWTTLDQVRDYLRDFSHFDPRQKLATIRANIGVDDYDAHPYMPGVSTDTTVPEPEPQPEPEVAPDGDDQN